MEFLLYNHKYSTHFWIIWTLVWNYLAFISIDLNIIRNKISLKCWKIPMIIYFNFHVIYHQIILQSVTGNIMKLSKQAHTLHCIINIKPDIRFIVGAGWRIVNSTRRKTVFPVDWCISLPIFLACHQTSLKMRNISEFMRLIQRFGK